jgi:hypothetical protein
MHKAKRPSFISRHRLIILALLFWVAAWGGLYFVFVTFPYFIDLLNLNSAGSSIAVISTEFILVAIVIATFASIIDGFVRDRRRVLSRIKSTPVPSENVVVQPSA